jgi:V/A-type H+-transporting ATPase subunit E
MNGIDKITARIARETQEEVAVIQERAQEKYDEIKSEYEARAQLEYDRLMREGTRDAGLQSQRLSGAAALEAKKFILAMKQRSVSDILDAARDRICNLPEAEYTAFLSRLAAKASFTGEEELVFNSRDRARVASEVVKGANALLKKAGKTAALTVGGSPGEFQGGLLLCQGDIVVNCTVETLIDMSREKLSTRIAELLFAE